MRIGVVAMCWIWVCWWWCVLIFVGWVCCGLFLFDVVLLVGLGVCFVSGLV